MPEDASLKWKCVMVCEMDVAEGEDLRRISCGAELSTTGAAARA